MFSDVATESTVHAAVAHVRVLLKAAPSYETRQALRDVGRHLLTLFEWDTPKWVQEEGYDRLFRDDAEDATP